MMIETILFEYNAFGEKFGTNCQTCQKYSVASKINTSPFHSDPYSGARVDESQIIRFYLFWIDSVHFVNRLTFFRFTYPLALSIFLTRI